VLHVLLYFSQNTYLAMRKAPAAKTKIWFM